MSLYRAGLGNPVQTQALAPVPQQGPAWVGTLGITVLGGVIVYILTKAKPSVGFQRAESMWVKR